MYGSVVAVYLSSSPPIYSLPQIRNDLDLVSELVHTPLREAPPTFSRGKPRRTRWPLVEVRVSKV